MPHGICSCMLAHAVCPEACMSCMQHGGSRQWHLSCLLMAPNLATRTVAPWWLTTAANSNVNLTRPWPTVIADGRHLRHVLQVTAPVQCPQGLHLVDAAAGGMKPAGAHAKHSTVQHTSIPHTAACIGLAFLITTGSSPSTPTQTGEGRSARPRLLRPTQRQDRAQASAYHLPKAPIAPEAPFERATLAPCHGRRAGQAQGPQAASQEGGSRACSAGRPGRLGDCGGRRPCRRSPHRHRGHGYAANGAGRGNPAAAHAEPAPGQVAEAAEPAGRGIQGRGAPAPPHCSMASGADLRGADEGAPWPCLAAVPRPCFWHWCFGTAPRLPPRFFAVALSHMLAASPAEPCHVQEGDEVEQEPLRGQAQEPAPPEPAEQGADGRGHPPGT